MRFVHGHVLFFANASKCTASDAFAVGIQTCTSARNTEIAQIVLGRTGGYDKRRVSRRSRQVRRTIDPPRRLPSSNDNEQARKTKISDENLNMERSFRWTSFSMCFGITSQGPFVEMDGCTCLDSFVFSPSRCLSFLYSHR